MTCHNRRLQTMACLARLFQAELASDLVLHVTLVDDGCTDGTGDAVRAEFPQVLVVAGDGSLFWNRGMIKAWDVASIHLPDYYLWLNDDTELHPSAIIDLMHSSRLLEDKCIVVGSTSAIDNGNLITYGGRNSSGTLLIPDGSPQRCLYFNGNCVLVPKYVFQVLGTLDPYYRHSFGDFDYGYRALRSGVESWISTTIVGTCDQHHQFPKWRNQKVPLLSRFKAFYSPLGCNPLEVFHLDRQRTNLMVGIAHFISTHLRVICPSLWSKGNT